VVFVTRLAEVRYKDNIIAMLTMWLASIRLKWGEVSTAGEPIFIPGRYDYDLSD
jgi:hypothetical protein